MAKDYTKVTAQGQRVVGIYMDMGDDFHTLMAIIDKGKSAQAYNMPRYFWAWAYHLENGTWGQGHYGCETIKEAERGLKSKYKRVEKINFPTGIVRIDTHDDGFGKYPDRFSAMKRLYYIVKHRPRDEIFLKNYDGTKVIYYTRYDRKKDAVYIWPAKSKSVYRLYANGNTKPVPVPADHVVHRGEVMDIDEYLARTERSGYDWDD